MKQEANQFFNQDDFEFELDGRTYYAEVHASAYYHYTSGTMYRRNGDPGDPPEEDFDVLSVTVENVQESGTDDTVPVTQDMIDTVHGMLEDGDYDWEWAD